LTAAIADLFLLTSDFSVKVNVTPFQGFHFTGPPTREIKKTDRVFEMLWHRIPTAKPG
jgi:hypothetical protein